MVNPLLEQPAESHKKSSRQCNLLDDQLVDVLLDSAAGGVNTVEREGVSRGPNKGGPKGSQQRSGGGRWWCRNCSGNLM